MRVLAVVMLAACRGPVPAWAYVGADCSPLHCVAALADAGCAVAPPMCCGTYEAYCPERLNDFTFAQFTLVADAGSGCEQARPAPCY